MSNTCIFHYSRNFVFKFVQMRHLCTFTTCVLRKVMVWSHRKGFSFEPVSYILFCFCHLLVIDCRLSGVSFDRRLYIFLSEKVGSCLLLVVGCLLLSSDRIECLVSVSNDSDKYPRWRKKPFTSSLNICPEFCWDGGHEQLISNGGKFIPAFTESDKKKPIMSLHRLSRLWAL